MNIYFSVASPQIPLFPSLAQLFNSFINSFNIKFITLFLCFILSLPSYAQQVTIDSLFQKFETAQPGFDQIDYLLGITRMQMVSLQLTKMKETLDKASVIAKKHNDLAGLSGISVFEGLYERIKKGKPEAVLEKMEAAVQIAKVSGDQNAITFANYQYAEIYSKLKGDYKKAEQLLLQLIEQFDETVTMKNKSSVYKNLGIAYTRLGDDQKAITYLNKALILLDSVALHPDKHHALGRVSALYADKGFTNTVQAAVRLSQVYSRTGQMKEAERILIKNLALAEANKHQDYIAWVSGNLGQLHFKTGDYQQTISFYNRAVHIWETLQANNDLVEYQVYLGDVFFKLKEYDVAINNYQKSSAYHQNNLDTLNFLIVKQKEVAVLLEQKKLEECQQTMETLLDLSEYAKNEQIKMEVLRTAGKVELALGNYTEALVYLKKVLHFAKTAKDKNLEIQSLTEIAENHILLNQLELANQQSKAALLAAKEADRTDFISKNCQLLASIAEKQADYKTALSFTQQYLNLENDLLSTNTQAILRQEQVRQNVNEYKEAKEASAYQAELLTTRNRLYLGLLLALLTLLIVGGYLYQQLKKVRANLEKRNQQLDDLNKTKDKFFGIIAHDIRSPIIALEGVGEQMEYYLQKNKPEKLQRLAHRVDSTARRLNNLLDNLLNWALLQQGVIPYHPKALNVQAIAQNTVEMFQENAITKGVHLEANIDSTFQITADESAVHTILRNLVSNAIKFTPSGGTVSIGTEIKKGKLFITINDSGTGIAAHQLEQLFTLQKKSELGTAGEKGTGLGLTLVKELVYLNKGVLSVKSKLNQGTQFSIGLPIAV